MRKHDANLVTQLEKHEELVERQKFSINRLNAELGKVESNIDTRIDRCERNSANSFNELRKLNENKYQGTTHSIDKANNESKCVQNNPKIVNNLKAKMQRMNLKLDKMEEVDLIKSWTLQQIDEARFKLQDFIDFELKKVREDVDHRFEEAFTVDGLIGPKAPHTSFQEFLKYVERKFGENEKDFDYLEDDIESIKKNDIKQIKEYVDKIQAEVNKDIDETTKALK